MKRVQRQDFLPIKKDPRVDEGGILRVNAIIARVGVQDYAQADGTIVREFRPPDEVAKSVSTLDRLPITIGHPKARVTARNTNKLLKGLTSDCDYDNAIGVVEASLTITHKDAVDVALTTHRQLSCGYDCILDWTPGVWIDEHGIAGEAGKEYQYDCIQRDIKGNHVALVPRARAGSIASILDSTDSIICQDTIIDRNSMQIVRGNRVFTIDSDDAADIVALIEGQDKNIDTITAERDGLQAKVDGLQSQLDSAIAKVDGLEAKAAVTDNTRMDADAITTEVQARLDAWEEVRSHLKEAKFDAALSVDGIRGLYIKQEAPHLEAKLDGASTDYVSALWDVLKPSTRKQDSTENLKKDLEGSQKQDSKEVNDLAKRKSNLGKFN